MFLLKICEILWLFVNTLTADDKYSLRYRESLRQTIQVQLSKKQKTFVNLMPNFRNLFHVLNILKKKYYLHCSCIFEIIYCEFRSYINIENPSRVNMIRGPKNC